MLLLSTYQTLPKLAFCLSSNKRIKSKLTRLWTRFIARCQQFIQKISGGDSNVSAQASMKLSITPSTNYEYETRPKHKIYLKQFKSQT